MKTVTTLSILSVMLAALAATAMASNYPPDYTDESVIFHQDGSFLIARAGSGCGSVEVLGYKNSGYLAQFHPEKVSAYVTVTCVSNNYGNREETKRTRVIDLGREWHGNGYLSTAMQDSPFDHYSFFLNQCSTTVVQLAFTDNMGHWDSRYGQNYTIDADTVFANQTGIKTGVRGCSMSFQAWDIIVGAMK